MYSDDNCYAMSDVMLMKDATLCPYPWRMYAHIYKVEPRKRMMLVIATNARIKVM